MSNSSCEINGLYSEQALQQLRQSQALNLGRENPNNSIIEASALQKEAPADRYTPAPSTAPIDPSIYDYGLTIKSTLPINPISEANTLTLSSSTTLQTAIPELNGANPLANSSTPTKQQRVESYQQVEDLSEKPPTTIDLLV